MSYFIRRNILYFSWSSSGTRVAIASEHNTIFILSQPDSACSLGNMNVIAIPFIHLGLYGHARLYATLGTYQNHRLACTVHDTIIIFSDKPTIPCPTFAQCAIYVSTHLPLNITVYISWQKIDLLSISTGQFKLIENKKKTKKRIETLYSRGVIFINDIVWLLVDYFFWTMAIEISLISSQSYDCFHKKLAFRTLTIMVKHIYLEVGFGQGVRKRNEVE